MTKEELTCPDCGGARREATEQERLRFHPYIKSAIFCDHCEVIFAIVELPPVVHSVNINGTLDVD